MIIDYDKYSLIINNKKVLINSAAFHYFRCPGIDTWRDRLSKIKACGYNTVDFYFCWGYHSHKPGAYDFTGIRDIRALLDLTVELDLHVIARPGPFINAELSLGGLPTWLLNIPGMIIRNKKDGNFVYSKPYMKALREWYSRIIPIINEYHNIIAFQIENEYFTNEAEPDYMQELYDMSRSLGIKAPIFHNDALSVGLYSDIVNIYAFDNYPTINLNYNWKDFPDTFGVLDNAESNLKEYKDDAPLLIAELQAGWFDRWDGIGYEKIHPHFEEQHINIVTKTALSQGITMFNHYMGCGGTSWDKLASCEVYTSYDFAAPISETGIPRKNYFKAKQINYFLNSFNLASTELIEEFHAEVVACHSELDSESIRQLESVSKTEQILKQVQDDNSMQDTILENENLFIKLRKDNLNGCKWLFIRNFNILDKNLNILDKFNIKIKPFDMKILPVDLNLNACKIDFSSMEIFARVENANHEKVFLLIDKDSEIYISAPLINGINRIKSDNLEDLSSYKFTKDDQITEIIFIKPETADKTWIINNKILTGVDFLTDNSAKAAFKKAFEKEDLPQLTNWKAFKCSPEIDFNYDYSSWDVLNEPEKFDCITNATYDDYIWYKGSFKHTPDMIEISAKHCWAVYLNGKQIYQHDTLGIDHEISENITFEINKHFSHPTGRNELTILVQNLGFDKGFQNELVAPRGILSLKTIPEKEIEWRIRGGLAPVIEEWDFMPEDNLENSSENAYLVQLSANFKINPANKKVEFNPLLLDLSDAKFNKADIYLNGNHIGRFWKSKGPQTLFYMPEEFINPVNRLSLIIWDRENVINFNKDFDSGQVCVNIKIRNIQAFELKSVEGLNLT